MGVRPRKIPSPDSKIAQDVLEQTDTIFQDVRRTAMHAYIKYKAYYDKKKPMPQNLNNLITFTFYSQKQFTKEAEFLLQIFDGLDHILFQKYYRTINIWYAKMAPIKRKFFTEWGYANSHPANSYQIYQLHHANGIQTGKLSLNMMIYTLEHGSDKPIIDSDRDHLVTPNSP